MYLCIANHFITTKNANSRRGYMPPVVRVRIVVYKVIGVTFINRPGLFYFLPRGKVSHTLYLPKSMASFFLHPSVSTFWIYFTALV